MITRTLLLTAALLAATTTLATAAAPKPKTLALRLADFPAGAKMHQIVDTAGRGGLEYAAAFSVKVVGREELVTDQVWVIPPGAKSPTPGLVDTPESNYRDQAAANSGFHGEKPLALPRYGDEQTANWADYRNSDGAERARSALVVRKGDVIWVLTVENCSETAVAGGCLLRPFPPKITQAQAVAQLKTYAGKQRARVGNA